MAIPVTLFGSTRYVPETKERNWGAEGTSLFVDLAKGANGTSTLENDIARVRYSSTDTALAAGATLTPTHNIHRVSGSGGAVTLDAVTAFAAGSYDGQVLVLRGTDNANTVTIPATSNVELNGPITLTDGDAITFNWDDTAAEWREVSRNN